MRPMKARSFGQLLLRQFETGPQLTNPSAEHPTNVLHDWESWLERLSGNTEGLLRSSGELPITN